MRRFLLRVLDMGTDPRDDPDLVLRKRTAVGTSMAICVASLMFSAIAALGERQVLLAVALLEVLGQVLNLALFARTRNLVLATVINITLGLLLVFTGIPALGGLALSAGSAVWGILLRWGRSCSSAAVPAGRRTSVSWR